MDKENDKSINSNTSKKTTITGILQVVLLLSAYLPLEAISANMYGN